MGPDWYVSSLEAEESKLTETVGAASTSQPKHLHVPSAPCMSELILESASQELGRFITHRGVHRKLSSLVQCRDVIMAALASGPTGASVEQYQVVLCYVLARANPQQFLSHLAFMKVYLPQVQSLKVFSDVCVAVKCLLKLDAPREQQAPYGNGVSDAASVQAVVASSLLSMGFPDEDVSLALHLLPATVDAEECFRRVFNFLADLSACTDKYGFTRERSVEALVYSNFEFSRAISLLATTKARERYETPQ